MEFKWLETMSSAFFQVLIPATILFILITLFIKEQKYNRAISVFTIFFVFLWITYLAMGIMLIVKG